MTTKNGTGGTQLRMLLFFAVSLSIVLLASFQAFADPTGADITYNDTSTVGTGSPMNRSDARGTITTIILSSIQQDQRWKAYVGNVSGVLTLDDASGNTIYDWDLTGVTINGEVYAIRTDSPSFVNVQCLDVGNRSAEEFFHNMTGSEADSINKTFNYTLHSGFFVGEDEIVADDCPSTATYVNDTRQNMSAGATPDYQEVLLMDGNYNVLYTTLIEDDQIGYTVGNETYDFQMLLPESNTKSAPTTYYFFTEIGS